MVNLTRCRTSQKINLWVSGKCLDRVGLPTSINPKCEQHHPMGWGSGLTKKDKASFIGIHLSLFPDYQRLQAPATMAHCSPELWARTNLLSSGCFCQVFYLSNKVTSTVTLTYTEVLHLLESIIILLFHQIIHDWYWRFLNCGKRCREY